MIDDLMAWYGGNYVVSSASKNLALGKQYLVFYAKRFPELAWDKQATLPAQAVAGRLDTPVLLAMIVGTVGGWWCAGWFWRVGVRNYTGASA